VDTGPLVAYFDASERFHAWAVDQLSATEGPAYSCEPVIAEAWHLLRQLPLARKGLLQLIKSDLLELPFHLRGEVEVIDTLIERYRNVPMSLADACLVRMAELYVESPVMTLDSDFRIYRKHGRQLIPTIMPSET
jgi:predicted nucleic acid-binding protein